MNITESVPKYLESLQDFNIFADIFGPDLTLHQKIRPNFPATRIILLQPWHLRGLDCYNQERLLTLGMRLGGGSSPIDSATCTSFCRLVRTADFSFYSVDLE